MKDKIVIQPENRTTLDRIKEQTDTAEPAPPPADLSAPPTANMDAPPPPEAPDNIEPPTHDTSTSEPECPEGSHYDPVSGTCVPDEIPEVSPPQNAPIETPSVGETDQLKVSPPIPEEPAPSPPSAEAPPLPPAEEQPAPQEQQNAAPECPVGSHYDEFSNTCIPDEIPAVTEIKFDKPLKLGEPFANYDSFDACVAANQDKDDPEAYCASLENKTEKQPASEIWSPQRGHIRDIKLATAINSQSKKLEEIYTILSKAIAETGKPVATEAKLRAKQGKTLKQLITETQTQHAVLKGLVETHQKNSLAETAKTEQTAQNQLEEIKKLRDAHNETVTFFTAKLAEVCASLKTASENMQNFTDSLTKTQTGYNTKIATIQNLTTKIQETQTNCNTKIEALEQQRQEDKQAYETILEAVNKRYGELKDNTKTLEDRIKEQEDELEKRKCEEGYHYDEKEQKCVPDTPPEQAEETKKLTETVENLSTKVDNLTDKLKGDFKAHNPKPVKETADDAPINDNMRTGN